MKEGKSFQISQNEVLNAYKAVKANKGAGGVDGVDFEMFEKNWKKSSLQTLEPTVIRYVFSETGKRR